MRKAIDDKIKKRRTMGHEHGKAFPYANFTKTYMPNHAQSSPHPLIQAMAICDVGLPLELTSGLERDRGVSGSLRGVLVAPARHHEKLGRLSIYRICGVRLCVWRDRVNGLEGAGLVDVKRTGGLTGYNREASRRHLVVRSAATLSRPEPTWIGAFRWKAYAVYTVR